jgi:uncharacterized membrane protein YukC
MSGWEIAALLREAEQVRNDWTKSDTERADLLKQIRSEIERQGGDGSSIQAEAKPRTAQARATRTSKPAAARKKA